MSGLSSTELAERARQKARVRLERLRMRKRLWPHDLGAYAEDCLTIRPKTGTPRKFVLNSVQRKLDAALDNQLAETGRVRAIILKARQMGVSTYVGARFYHRMRFHSGHRTLIMTHRDDATTNLAGMVRRYHDHEPEPPALSVDNATEMVLENESGIAVATAGAQVTGAGRSFTFQLGHLSEIPSWHAATTHLNAILPAFPTTTGEIIFEATAKGAAGPFYEMAMAAQKGQSPFPAPVLPVVRARRVSDRADAWVGAPGGHRQDGARARADASADVLGRGDEREPGRDRRRSPGRAHLEVPAGVSVHRG